MPVKAVTTEWLEQDAFIIGGGSSLKGFDFATLRGHNCLGVNDAFRLGPEVCPRLIFGDDTWWQQTKFDVENYAKAGGRVYSIAPASINLHVPWLEVCRRVDDGWSSGEHLGWNRSTGAAAINLAVNLGAKRIFLLGFDCGPGDNRKTHWHTHRRIPTPDHSFNRFLPGFALVARKLQECHPNVTVFNVSPNSRLEHWQKISFGEMEGLLHGPH
jgi:hypothetical protein